MLIGTTRIRAATVVTITVPASAIIIAANPWDANFFGIIYKYEISHYDERIIFCLKKGDAIPEDTRFIGSGIVLFEDWAVFEDQCQKIVK